MQHGGNVGAMPVGTMESIADFAIYCLTQ